ncbi:hypothetical protein ABPG75_003672 [Micractinium tetrahymenae]
MPPLSLAVAARPAALNAFNRPLIARSAAPQALRRTWGARRWRRASTSSGGGSDDDEQAFARQRTLHMVGKAPDLLAINSCVWQTALAVMQLCGLAQTEALEVASSNPQALCVDWLAADKLVNRLVLQRCLPGGPSAGQVYERHAGHVAGKSAERLAGRLLFLQHHGLLHLLVENKGEARREWRRLHGFRADRRAAGEPAFISLSDLSKPDAHLASLPAVQAAGGLPALQAFMAELKFSPAWLELEAAAEAERARLLGLLPEDLRQAAEKRRQAADEKEQ